MEKRLTARQLKAAAARARKGQEAVRERNRLIAEALADGWTQQQIADATGLSRGRISQFAMAGKEKR